MTRPVFMSSANSKWITPQVVLSRVLRVFGGQIDTDPCTDPSNPVGASRFCTTGGLESPWEGAVYVNPPGGRVGARSASSVWWQRCMQCIDFPTDTGDRVTDIIFCAFNLNSLQTCQNQHDPARSILAYPIAIPRRRVAYVDPVTGRSTVAPPHPSAFIYIPVARDRTSQFCEVFGEIGGVIAPKVSSAWTRGR